MRFFSGKYNKSHNLDKFVTIEIFHQDAHLLLFYPKMFYSSHILVPHFILTFPIFSYKKYTRPYKYTNWIKSNIFRNWLGDCYNLIQICDWLIDWLIDWFIEQITYSFSLNSYLSYIIPVPVSFCHVYSGVYWETGLP